MATSNHDQFQCSFQNWITQQHQDQEELVNLLSADSDEEQLKLVAIKGMKHFEEYYERRTIMAKQDVASFLSPKWCSSFEKAFLWIGGCRPSLAFRLIYSVCGSELDAHMARFLQGERRKGNLAELSARQLDMINTLHCNTIRDEDKMSTRMASLQEDIADEPLAMIAKSAEKVGESSEELELAMDARSLSLAGILGEADRLRLSTLKELMAILTPLQTTDLLIATKKLHLSMHEWGKRRDHQLTKLP